MGEHVKVKRDMAELSKAHAGIYRVWDVEFTKALEERVKTGEADGIQLRMKADTERWIPMSVYNDRDAGYYWAKQTIEIAMEKADKECCLQEMPHKRYLEPVKEGGK